MKTCDFREADLSRASFRDAALCAAEFDGANVTGADLAGASVHSYRLGVGELPDGVATPDADQVPQTRPPAE